MELLILVRRRQFPGTPWLTHVWSTDSCAEAPGTPWLTQAEISVHGGALLWCEAIRAIFAPAGCLALVERSQAWTFTPALTVVRTCSDWPQYNSVRTGHQYTTQHCSKSIISMCTFYAIFGLQNSPVSNLRKQLKYTSDIDLLPALIIQLEIKSRNQFDH